MKETSIVAKNIRNFRLSNLWTQKDLAKKTNVKTKVISKWEKGKVALSEVDIEKLVKVFNIEKEVFFKEDYNLVNDKKELLKIENKTVKIYNILKTINIITVILLAIVFSMNKRYINIASIISLLIFVVSLVLYVLIISKDIKTDKTIEYSKKVLRSILAEFMYFGLLVFIMIFFTIINPQVAYILNSYYVVSITIMNVLIYYFILKGEKIGVLLAILLVTLNYAVIMLMDSLYGAEGMTLVSFLLIQSASFVIIIEIFIKYKKQKKFIGLTTFLAFITSYTYLMSTFRLYNILAVTDILYSILLLISLASLVFFKNKKLVIFGFFLYLIYVFNRNYVVIVPFIIFLNGSYLLTYIKAYPQVPFIIASIVSILFWLNLYNNDKYKKIKMIISIFIILVIYEISTIINNVLFYTDMISSHDVSSRAAIFRLVGYIVILIVFGLKEIEKRIICKNKLI